MSALATLQNMKGNLRPQSTMNQPHSESLPSARIRCNAGRIQVGTRTYQSASDALSAYMQQFEPKGPGRARVSPSVRDSSLAAAIQKSAQSVGSSALRRKCDPANVTGLLTGGLSFLDKSGVTLDDTVSADSHHLLNGVGSAQKSAKHSVSFVLPNSADESIGRSKLSGSVGVSGYSHSLSSPQLHSSSQFDSKLHCSLTSNSITQNGSSNLLGLTQLSNTNTAPSHGNTSAGGDVSSRLSPKSNGFVDNRQSGFSSRFGPSGELPKQNGRPVHSDSPGCAEVDTQHAKSEVELLLTEAPSQGELDSLNEPSAGEGKLRNLLRETSVPESSSTSSDKSALQQEVEEALSRSAQLLETIKTDVLVSPRCISDAGSMSTDLLLSINPQNPAERITPSHGRESRSRHRYSYHTPAHQPRSISVGPVMDGSEHRTLQRSGRRRSVDSLDSVGLGRDRFADLNESMSALSDSGSILKRLQTADGSGSGLAADTKQTNSRAAGPPSWIQELIAPVSTHHVNGKDLSDSLFSQRDASGARKAPSWVNGLDQSDLASSVGTQDLHDAADSLVLGKEKKLHGADTVRKAFEAAILADDSVASELSYAGPGLKYSDLASSPAVNKGGGASAAQRHHRPSAKVSRTNSFGGIGSSPSVRRGTDKSKPPVTMSRIFQDLAGVDATKPKSHNLAPSLSSSQGADSNASLLRRKVCEDSVEVKSSLDRYLSQVAGEAETKAGRKARQMEQMSEIPRCSSMNLQNGVEDVPSNITGASSITKDSNFSSKLCLDDPTLTPARQSRALLASKEAGGVRGAGEMVDEYADPDLLDGDRPWESALPSFKDPVYVGNSSPAEAPDAKGRPETPTLSGGQQPGSMEALKQMLFRLQNEESSSAMPPASAAAAAAAAATPQGDDETELVPALKDYDFEVEPGGQSLERALVHLGRLKTLVQTGTAPAQTFLTTQEHTTSS